MDQASRRVDLLDMMDRVLDKGIVIDAGIGVAVIGIELVAVQVKITVASLETYLQLAEDPRAYALGLIGGAPRRSTQEELERLTEPKESVPPATAPRAAPPADPGLPLAAYYDEELSTNRPQDTEPEQT
ncbi:MAG: gas vesicle protein [Gemmatimonadetes bacterium]|nr:gas vesicle protein [Gemmatimonadota bacterium]